MPTIDNQEEVNRVRSYIEALRDEFSKIGICPRSFAAFPFDHIGLALVSKAFSISHALLVLLEAGFAEEALGFSRTLVECALTLRFLTQDRDKLLKRTWDYAHFEVTDKQFWMHHALKHVTGTDVEREIRDFAKRFDLKDDPTLVRTHWSGKEGFAWRVNLEDHPLDNASNTELAKKSAYAVEYHATSSFVHCFSPVVNNFLPSEGIAFRIRESSGEFEKPSQKVLFILIDYLHSCVAYALFGINEERTKRMNDLYSEILASLLPYRKTHS
jgi:hypothetical protein